jgi:hypothetical protein
LREVTLCRTAALGGYKLECDGCGHKEISYASCRNRHCPKCQGGARADWLRARAAEVLEGVKYFHVVFTLPEKLGPVALQNKRIVYGVLFRAASETLTEIGRDPKHLGAKIGFLAVLHTWGQTLSCHPHLHCIAPGGGISLDEKSWISRKKTKKRKKKKRKDFFLPVRVLSDLFKKKFLDYLGKAFDDGKLSLYGKLTHLKDARNWHSLLRGLDALRWVVYAKRPFGGAEQVLKYLARYTHRVAISNRRLLRLKDGKVTFTWKDYRHGNRQRTMTLKAEEFIRRFLLHELPTGFQRIRYYGFLANRARKTKLELCRRLLNERLEPARDTGPIAHDTSAVEGSEVATYASCPVCENGRMVPVGTVGPDREFAWRVLAPQPIDSS